MKLFPLSLALAASLSKAAFSALTSRVAEAGLKETASAPTPLMFSSDRGPRFPELPLFDSVATMTKGLLWHFPPPPEKEERRERNSEWFRRAKPGISFRST